MQEKLKVKKYWRGYIFLRDRRIDEITFRQKTF